MVAAFFPAPLACFLAPSVAALLATLILGPVLFALSRFGDKPSTPAKPTSNLGGAQGGQKNNTPEDLSPVYTLAVWKALNTTFGITTNPGLDLDWFEEGKVGASIESFKAGASIESFMG